MSFFVGAFVGKSDISGPEIKIFYHNLGFCALLMLFMDFWIIMLFYGSSDDCVLVKWRTRELLITIKVKAELKTGKFHFLGRRKYKFLLSTVKFKLE